MSFRIEGKVREDSSSSSSWRRSSAGKYKNLDEAPSLIGWRTQTTSQTGRPNISVCKISQSSSRKECPALVGSSGLQLPASSLSKILN